MRYHLDEGGHPRGCGKGQLVRTVGEWQRHITAMLTDAGCDSPAFEVVCLLEDIGGVPRGKVPSWQERELSPLQQEAVAHAAAERAAGRPLQYILGEWEFLDLTLKVGEGVLIPRPDTEVLCETAAKKLRAAFPDEPTLSVLDLCAGTGCVGLGVASLCESAVPTCVELSKDAWPYLTENMARYARFHGRAVQADVLCEPPFAERFHALVSNPPYIPTADIAGLMREVQHEPRMALDGSADGLCFYRAIAERWLSCLLPGGICAVEVGIGQAEEVAALFVAAGLEQVEMIPDLAGVLRVVAGNKPR